MNDDQMNELTTMIDDQMNELTTMIETSTQTLRIAIEDIPEEVYGIKDGLESLQCNLNDITNRLDQVVVCLDKIARSIRASQEMGDE